MILFKKENVFWVSHLFIGFSLNRYTQRMPLLKNELLEKSKM